MIVDTHLHRFYGVYLGICWNTADPEARNRIQLKIPLVLGESISEWADPCLPPNWRSGLVQAHSSHTVTGTPNQTLTHDHNHQVISLAPPVNTPVWVMFQAGDPDHPVWIGTT